MIVQLKCLPLYSSALQRSKASMLTQPPAPSFQAWFVARGLTQFVQRERRPDLPSLDNDRWLFFRLQSPNQAPARPDATVAFHGTWWYALWGILKHGRILSSDTEDKGHEFWLPGGIHR